MRRRLSLLWTGLLVCAAPGSGRSAEPAQWIAVTAPAFRAELAPLIEQRRAQGLQVAVIETTNLLTLEQIQRGDGAPLRSQLVQLTQRARTNYLLLVGAFSATATNAGQIVVPALPGTIGRMKGQPGDYGYCLPDTNGAPTVAVGRFPARTVEEVRFMVRKTLDLEQDREPGAWRNRLLLLAGDPGGGPMADMLVEQVVGPRLESLHPSWSVRAIFAGDTSRFHLPAERFGPAAEQRLAEGELFSIFMGHSVAGAMWLTGTNFMTRDDWARLNIPRGRGVFLTCGCFACQFQGRDGEGYALAALRNPRGPAAVIGACAESYAAPGQLALDGLLQCLKQPPFAPRLADYWLAVQNGLASGGMDPITFNLYDQFDGSRGKVPLAAQRREHLEMWLLLGDPALRLPITPADVALELKEPVRPGKSVTVTGVLPGRLANASVRVTLERPAGSLPTGLVRLPANSPETHAARERLAVENHERANEFVLLAAETILTTGAFACPLTVPANLPWSNVVIRVTAATGNESAMGTVTVAVSR